MDEVRYGLTLRVYTVAVAMLVEHGMESTIDILLQCLNPKRPTHSNSFHHHNIHAVIRAVTI